MKANKLSADAVNAADAQRSCFNKKQFFTKNAARDACSKQNKRREKSELPLSVYRCAVCHFFHLTSKPKKDHHAISRTIQSRKDVDWPLEEKKRA